MDVVPYTQTTVVIVMKVYSDTQDRTMGIIVDAVSDVHNIKKESIKPAPVMHGAINNDFIQGLAKVDNKMIIVVDIDALLNSKELAIESVV